MIMKFTRRRYVRCIMMTYMRLQIRPSAIDLNQKVDWEHDVNGIRVSVLNSRSRRLKLDKFRTFAGCDGVIMSTPECYEPQTLTAIRDLFARTSRSIWVCGPLLATSEQALAQEREQSSKALEIEEFMDSILSSHGKHSLVYVCDFVRHQTISTTRFPVLARVIVLVTLRAAKNMGVLGRADGDGDSVCE